MREIRRVHLMFALPLLVLAFAGAGDSASWAVESIQAPSAAAAPGSGTEVKVGLGVENREVVGASDSFDIAPDTKIYGWVRVKDVAPGSTITLVFRKGDKEVFQKELPVPSVPFRTNAYRTFRSGDEGDWSLVVLSADGKELASATFKVTIKK